MADPLGRCRAEPWSRPGKQLLAVRDEGAVRAVGVSNHSTSQLDELIKDQLRNRDRYRFAAARLGHVQDRQFGAGREGEPGRDDAGLPGLQDAAGVAGGGWLLLEPASLVVRPAGRLGVRRYRRGRGCLPARCRG